MTFNIKSNIWTKPKDKQVAHYILEQVAVSTKRAATSQIPNYPNLPSQLLCQVQNVTLHVCVSPPIFVLFFFSFCLINNLAFDILIGRQRNR